MRGMFYLFSILGVMGLAYWAYSENYRTQDALRDAAELQRAIGEARETLSVLQAEWAYLNRPDRLRDLAELNFGEIGLLPITPEQFSSVSEVSHPRVDPMIADILGSINISSATAGGTSQ